LVTIPPYFLETRTGIDYPPPVNHPEFYYGFFGVTVAWQVLFLIIGSDPRRYRPVMLAALIEKSSFVIAIVSLYLLARVPAVWLIFASCDGAWFVLFLLAYWKTSPG
jgi:membrane-associated phospholipid phosphatase